MRCALGLMVAALFVPFVTAQEDVADPQAAFNAIKADLDAANAVYREAMGKIRGTDEYKKLLAAYRAAPRGSDEQRGLREELSAMTSQLERPDRDAYAKRFAAGAKTYQGTEGAIPFLSWLLSSRGELAKGAFEELMKSHTASPKMADVTDSLSYVTRSGVPVEDVRKMAGLLIENNPILEVKAAGYYVRAQSYLGSGRDRKPKEGFESAYASDLAMVVETAPESIVAMRAQAPEFVKTRLQIGMKAPDIVGEDLDGVGFKLSDYRGKVVVLDFWGDW